MLFFSDLDIRWWAQGGQVFFFSLLGYLAALIIQWIQNSLTGIKTNLITYVQEPNINIKSKKQPGNWDLIASWAE